MSEGSPDGVGGAAYAVVMTTTASQEEAEALARALVETRLAACVQVTRVVSHYVWKGAAERAAEWLLLVKTRSSAVPGVRALLAERHSYEVPEIIDVPVTGGNAAYLAWIDESVDPPSGAAGG